MLPYLMWFLKFSFKKEAETRYARCKEEAVGLLNEAVEKASEMREDNNGPVVSKDVVLRSKLASFENCIS